jgi:hypothetical protein
MDMPDQWNIDAECREVRDQSRTHAIGVNQIWLQPSYESPQFGAGIQDRGRISDQPIGSKCEARVKRFDFANLDTNVFAGPR